MKTRLKKDGKKRATVTLKTVAAHVGLTPGTVSAVLNDSPASHAFPQHTKDRVLAAARELNYRPNYFARSLRVMRTYTIGVLTEEIGDPYGAMIISGIERYLRQRNFFFLTVAHRHDTELLQTYAHLLLERGVEGLITIDTSIRETPQLPTIAVAGHQQVENVTNLIIDHKHGAQMALAHLRKLGHTEIAFMIGPARSSDSQDRWKAIVQGCLELVIDIDPRLVVRLKGEKVTAELGYVFTKKLLSSNQKSFTALFAYNDSSAIGAIRAIQEAGLRVPEDISVVGFDDIESAAYITPTLTTVRQPLQKMGEIAARTLLNRIEQREPHVPEITVEPEFVVRNSTAPPMKVADRANAARKEESQPGNFTRIRVAK